MAEAARLTAVIDADTKGAEAGLNRMGGLSDHVSGLFGGLLSTIGGFAAGGMIVNAAGTAFNFFKDQLTGAIEEGASANQVISQTNAVLASTHGAAGVTAQAVDDLSNKYMGLTGIQDDTVRSTANMLLTFTNIGAKGGVFDQATATALDMSVALGQDTKSSAIQLGKALNDPLTGITALQRVGVTFDAQQKQQIKNFMDAGNVAGAQGIILKELNKEFGGSAEAAGKANGGMKILAAQFDNVKQTIGQAIIPVLGQLGQAILPLVLGFANSLPGALKVVTGFIQSNVMPAVKEFGTWLQTVGAPALQKLASQVLAEVVPALQQLVAWAQAHVLPALAQLGQFITSTVIPAVQQLVTWFGDHVVPVLQTVVDVILTDVIPAYMQVYGALITNVIPAIENLWNKLAPLLIPTLQVLGFILKNVIGPAFVVVYTVAGVLINIIAGVIDVVEKIIGIFIFAGEVLYNQLKPGLDVVGSFLSTVFGPAFSVVSTYVQGLVDDLRGLLDILGHVKDAIGGAFSAIGNEAKSLHIPGFADGGVTPGGPVLVGERGPELLVPPAGSRVVSSGQTRQMLQHSASGGGGTTFIINGSDYQSSRQIAEHALTLQRRHALLGNTGGGY